MASGDRVLGGHAARADVMRDRTHRHGETRYIRPPGTERWIRLGEDEWQLLQVVRQRPDAPDCALEVPGWSADDIGSALARFAQLGLLDAHGQRPVPVQESVRTSAWILAGCLVLAVLALQVASIAQVVPWTSWFALRPPGWLAVALVLVLAATHETGHVLLAVAVGYPTTAFRLATGWLGWIPVPTVRLEQFWALSRAGRTTVVLGGAGMQLLLGAAAGCLWLVWARTGAPAPAVLLWLQTASILLAAVNLLPVYPLDGYWLIAVRLDRPHLREESRTMRTSSDAAAVLLTGLFLLWIAGTFLLP